MGHQEDGSQRLVFALPSQERAVPVDDLAVERLVPADRRVRVRGRKSELASPADVHLWKLVLEVVQEVVSGLPTSILAERAQVFEALGRDADRARQPVSRLPQLCLGIARRLSV
jgi:hypothetical protein